MAEPSTRHPLVTVVIAFLDEQRFLAGAVATVRAQELADWELVLVDDGSTDGSSATAADAVRTDPARVRVLRHPGGGNAGSAASRNLGLSKARGRYVCFLDADDRWLPEKLARQVELMRAHPAAAMVCGPSWHVPAGREPTAEPVAVSRLAPRLLRRGRFPRLIARGAIRTPASSDVMYRTDVLRQVDGVPAGPNMHEDQRTFVAVGLHGPVFVADEPLTKYTVRSDSLYGSVAHGGDAMVIVRQHLEFERWLRAYARRRGPAGLAVVAVLDAHRVRRGLTRRARLARHRVRDRWRRTR